MHFNTVIWAKHRDSWVLPHLKGFNTSEPRLCIVAPKFSISKIKYMLDFLVDKYVILHILLACILLNFQQGIQNEHWFLRKKRKAKLITYRSKDFNDEFTLCSSPYEKQAWINGYNINQQKKSQLRGAPKLKISRVHFSFVFVDFEKE